MSEAPIKIFYSYSRKDLDMRNTLEDHLSALREAGKISTWHDLQLEAGTEWEPAILKKLDTADIILLLVSRNFIASKYCYGTELERAIARHDAGTARVIPIILDVCDWNIPEVPFSKLTVLPTHARPIKKWGNRNEAFTDVTQKIRETVDQLRTEKLAAKKRNRAQQQLLKRQQREEAQRIQTDFSAFTLEGMDELFGNAPQSIPQPQSRRGDDLRLDLDLGFKEAVFGGEKIIRISRLETCDTCAGKGFWKNLQEHISCETCGAEGRVQIIKTLKITIPAGVNTGTRLRVLGEGDAGEYGDEAGDLYVYLSVNKDKQFKRDGINLLSSIEVSAEQAASGCELLINTIEGSRSILIPEMTKHGTVLRLRNFGVPKLEDQTQRGEHLVTVLITDSTPNQSAEGFLSLLDWIPDFTFLVDFLNFLIGIDVTLTRYQHQILKISVLSAIGLVVLVSIGQTTQSSPSRNLPSPEVSRPATTPKP